MKHKLAINNNSDEIDSSTLEFRLKKIRGTGCRDIKTDRHDRGDVSFNEISSADNKSRVRHCSSRRLCETVDLFSSVMI